MCVPGYERFHTLEFDPSKAPDSVSDSRDCGNSYIVGLDPTLRLVNPLG